MTRHQVITGLFIAALLALLFWVGRNVEFQKETVPVPLHGEALRNPFYAAIRFSEALGIDAGWQRVFTVPREDAVIVLANWNWSLSRQRRDRIERWVEDGGRLVVDQSLFGDPDEFERWSGIHRTEHEPGDDDDGESRDATTGRRAHPGDCTPLIEEFSHQMYTVCGVARTRALTSTRKSVWALRDGARIHGLRTAVGKGSVTMLDGSWFGVRQFLRGDHARLFVAATQLHHGDEIVFLTEEDHPSIVALAWTFGAPAILLLGASLGLALWRAGVRFGPRAAPEVRARRSLTEQIRGTGLFILRYGGGRALHAAEVRALRDAAVRRIPAYDRLGSEDRVVTLANLTGLGPDELRHALHFSGARGSHELRQTLSILENARRRILTQNKPRSKHGN